MAQVADHGCLRSFRKSGKQIIVVDGRIAMDIVAKKMPPDKDGVRIAELDEMSYRRELWEHTPLTDFWRVGRGIANRLAPYGILTMGDIARCSINNEDFLYKLFGVNAELLIDHAWGWEPVTMDYVKSYRPETKSISSGQVLQCAYTADKAKNVVLEMADAVSLDLIDKRLVTVHHSDRQLLDHIRILDLLRLRIDALSPDKFVGLDISHLPPVRHTDIHRPRPVLLLLLHANLQRCHNKLVYRKLDFSKSLLKSL